ncbi:hypothetical protein [Verrucomicrobium sp. BvORR034]|uniref:hypothetical protein n=1 Tax=Verrucomicrobium sp. BvORR034 TaxID=1396418 RepID=UPI002240FFCE|nr:hypothetical protein [Verrucomicrobium sp. BvORR034]
MKVDYVCLNLLRRPDRRFLVESTLPQEMAGLLRFVPAVDGRKIPSSRVRRWKIGNTGYAVNLSKRLVLREFLQGDSDVLFFFEDDVKFERDFWEKYQWMLANAPSDWAMLFLGGDHSQAPQSTGVSGIVKCVRTHLNHALLIKRDAAREILREISRKPFRHCLSDQTIAWLQNKLPTYAPARFAAGQRRSRSDNNGGVKGDHLWRPISAISARLDDDELAVMCVATRPGDRVLQWGACSSTLLLARWVGREGSVECIEADWGAKDLVRNGLADERLESRVRFYEPISTLGVKARRPMRSGAFKSYPARCIEAAGNGTFDLAVINGPYPVDCAMAAAKHLKSGSLLFLPGLRRDSKSPCRRSHELEAAYRIKFEVLHTPNTMTVFERR